MGRPTNKARKRSQRKIARYMRDREDLMLAGRIPFTAEGAVRNERVGPASQAEPTGHLGLAATAARNGWATPEEKKPVIVSELVKIATGNASEVGPDGIATGPAPKTRVYAAKVLAELDQIQYERDNPVAAGRAKGAVNVGVAVADVREVLRALEAEREQQAAGAS
jgi:hypothetical protein